MKNYTLNRVIVPFDFSGSSQEALRAALKMVPSEDSIEVLHVMPPLTSTESMIVLTQMSQEASEELIAEGVQKKFADSCKQDGIPKLSFTTIFGDAGTQIARFAKDKEAGLVVISSHGRTGLNRVLLGSVAERVVRLAPCPVLVLRADGE